jgi:hypothetical protein
LYCARLNHQSRFRIAFSAFAQHKQDEDPVQSFLFIFSSLVKTYRPGPFVSVVWGTRDLRFSPPGFLVGPAQLPDSPSC